MIVTRYYNDKVCGAKAFSIAQMVARLVTTFLQLGSNPGIAMSDEYFVFYLTAIPLNINNKLALK